MKQILFALAVLLSAGLALLPQAYSQVPGGPSPPQPYGPGDKGSVLKQPWLDTGSSPAPTIPAGPGQGTATPDYLHGLLDSTGANRTNTPPGTPSSLLPYDTMGINNDILVKPEMGQWMILITSYRGKDGPMRARKMVSELRSVYKLPAYVFNYGADEKRKEIERISKVVEKQKEWAKQNNLSLDQPIRVSHVKIEEYVGVLMAGYPTMEAAAKARDQLRKLPKPNPAVFKLEQDGDLLDRKFYTPEEGAKGDGRQEVVFVNPFERAFPVHNPTIKMDRPTDGSKLDVAALKHMNSAEDFSLFKCPKNYTLVIKQFNTPAVTSPRNEPTPTSGWLDTFGLGKKAERVDVAAENAHRLAEGLRKTKLEAYVLHMRFCSLVTIGGFDSLEDPHMLTMKNIIETRLVPAMEAAELFPQARAWQIPR
jgi:hypothetical protein